MTSREANFLKHHKNLLTIREYELLLTKQQEESKTADPTKERRFAMQYISQRNCMQNALRTTKHCPQQHCF